MSALSPSVQEGVEPLSSVVEVAYPRVMTSEPEDSALMLRYGDGDVDAFEVLYQRHKDSLYRYLWRLSAHPDIADDVFQETWGKIIKARRNYRPTARFTTFLFRVAHNCFIDYVRRNRRHDNSTDVDPDTRSEADNEPEDNTEQLLTWRRLIRALETLPEEQRNVFLLYEESGLSLDEIAHVTGVNRETAKSRLRYAVNKLKVRLAEASAEPGDRS